MIEMWQRIGLLVALLQSAEHAVNMSLQWVFTDDPFGDEHEDNFLKQIKNLKEFKRKKTLGQLHKILCERINMAPADKTLLAKFVEDRNRFAHRLFLEPGFSINEPEDVPRIREFVDALTDHSMKVLAVFHAHIEAWSEKHDLGDDDGSIKRPERLEVMVQLVKNHITRKGY